MRLDPTYLTYITKEEMRVLLAVEMGMRNHEFVPVHLIEKISHLGRSCSYTYLKLLLKNKLVYHQRKKYDGYKLTYLGYDYLALNVFMKRGVIKTIVGKIGVGKESDVYKCINDEGNEVILKFARLGRVSFKTVKNNRDYIKNRTQYSWLYLSRLQAIKEYAFMELLYKNEFPTPTPISQNRHGVVMSLVDGVPFTQVNQIEDCSTVHNELIDLVQKLAEHGLIHSDFNEFNLMIHPTSYKITMIDFPQMVSTSHRNAEYYYKRDIDCVHRYFLKKQKFVSQYETPFDQIVKIKDLDHEVRASGHIKKELAGNFQDLDILDEIQQASGSDEEDIYQGEENSDDEEQEQEEQSDDEQEEQKQQNITKKHAKKSSDDILDDLNMIQNEKKNLNQLDDDFDLNEEGGNNVEFDLDSQDENEKNEENKEGEEEGEEEESSEEEEEFDEEAEERRRQQIKKFKQEKKEKKMNKQGKSGKNDKLREQLLEKIKLQEEIDEQKRKQKELKKQQKQQKKEEKRQKELEEQQQQQENDDENDDDEDDDEEFDSQEEMEQYEEYKENQRKLMENQDLQKKVESHLSTQINKKFKKKFKIIKYTKNNGSKDVKNNREYTGDIC